MTIPNDFLPVEGQDGLYYRDHSFTFASIKRVSRELRSDDQHCFYNNTLPEEERIYMEQIFTTPEQTPTFTCILFEDIVDEDGNVYKPEIV